MLMNILAPNRSALRGFSMIEVLVAIIITTFGLLGLAGLMSKMQVAETEGYQRSQALILLSDMTERINAAMPGSTATGAPPVTDYANAATDSLTAPAGTGDSQPTDCSAKAFGGPRDICEWSNALKGAAEKSAAAANVGAMIGARGCVELIDAGDPSAGVCKPPTFRVSVVWQGLVPTIAQATTCGSGQYGNDNLRRVIAEQVTVGLPGCT